MSARYISFPAVPERALAKWLGPGAINPLAVDGKGGRGELLGRVERWVAASGRNVTQPGVYIA